MWRLAAYLTFICLVQEEGPHGEVLGPAAMKDKTRVSVCTIDFPYYYSTKFMASFKTAISGKLGGRGGEETSK